MRVVEDPNGPHTQACIRELLEREQPFAIGRMPGNEADSVHAWHAGGRDVGAITPKLRHLLEERTGFYSKPNTYDEVLHFWCEQTLAALRGCDLLFRLEVQGKHDRLVAEHHEEIHVWSACRLHQWVPSLEGKRVLVVSPFARSIAVQWAKRDRLREGFANGTKPFHYPEFELQTVKAHDTIKGNTPFPCADWRESFEQMADEIAALDFDLAILGCGSYGMPLTAHVKSLGRSAFYAGSYTQILFGIMGRRWEKNATLQSYATDAWKRPDADERPKTFMAVTGGCYW